MVIPPSHSLRNQWIVWWDNKRNSVTENSADYASRLTAVADFASVERFHTVYGFMKRPSELPLQTVLYIFQSCQYPAWEAMPTGGVWSFRVPAVEGRLDSVWQESLLALIGNELDNDLVMGVALHVKKRKDALVSVWVRDAGVSEAARFAVCEKLKQLWNLEKDDSLKYKTIAESLQDNTSFANSSTFKVV